MTQEKKSLLLKDLCARLPYGVKVNFKNGIHTINALYDDGSFWLDDKDDGSIEEIKPYLRPMSSMTDDEVKEYLNMLDDIDKSGLMCQKTITKVVDWLDKKMFDHRGLIPIRFAIEAPEDMYK